MKKSRRIFSFLAVALSAVLLFASAGALNSAKQVALADTSPYGKVVTKDSLKAGDYLEYGEYPQSEIKGDHRTTIQKLINAQFYGSSNATVSGKTVSDVMNRRTQNNGTGTGTNKYFTYDSTTGYFVANKDICSNTTPTYSGDSKGGTLILSKGDKIMEYISGVDAANKYPVYMLSSTGTALSYNSAPTDTSVRSATVRAYIDTLNDGTYYNSGTISVPEWTACNCIYCDCACNIGDGTVYTNTSSNGTLNSTSRNWSTSWYNSNNCYTLYESQTSENLKYYVGVWGFGYYTGPSNDSTFYNNYYKHINYLVNSSTKSFCYRDGKPLSNVGYDTGDFTYMNSGDLYNHAVWLYNQAISLTKSKCGKNLANNQIYKIEISPSITEYRPLGYHNYTCSYTIKVWATTNTKTCPYCSEKHHYGESSNLKTFTSKLSTLNSQYILGQNTVATTNGYTAGKQYYFKVEPIKWQVVASDTNGNYTLQSDIILDSMYYNLYSNSGSNFQTSYLRNWLNRDGSDTFTEKYNVLDLRKSSYGAFNEITCNVGRYGSGSSYYGKCMNNYESVSSIYGSFSDGLNRYVKGENGIKSNYASYATQETTYGGSTKATTPSFFQMAFSNVDTGLMQAVGGSSHKGRMNFSTSNTIITGDNLVTIPYSATKLVSGGKGYSLNSTLVCSDYAKATGLVCSYDSTDSIFNYDNDFGGRYGKNGTVNNGLIWVEDGYSSFTGVDSVYSSGGSKVLQQKTVAWFDNAGTITANDKKDPAGNYEQINQSAGVVPVIKINLSNSSNTVLVKKNSADSGASYQVVQDTEEKSTYKLMTLNSSAKTTDIQVTGYSKIDESNNQITVKLKYDSNYKFDYVKFVITKKDNIPGDTYYNAVEGDLYGQVYTYTKTTTTKRQKLRPTGSVYTTKITYTHYCTIVNYDTINNIIADSNGNREVIVKFGTTIYDDFEIRAYAVTDNETKMAEISGDEIRTLEYQVSRYSCENNVYKAIDPTKITLYEGQSSTINLKAGENYYSSVTSNGSDKPEYSNPVLTGNLDTSKKYTLSTCRVTDSKGNVSLKLSASGENGSSKDDLLNEINKVDGIPTFYSNYSGASFNAGIEHGGSDNDAKLMVDDVIYITDANGGNRNNLSNFATTGNMSFSEIKAISGESLSFRVYIKNAYIKNFENIDELINGKEVTTTEGDEEKTTIYEFFNVVVLDEGDKEDEPSIDTSKSTSQTGAGPFTYKSKDEKIELTISALASKTFSNGIEYEKYFTVTVSGLTVDDDSTLSPTRLKLITLDGFASIAKDTYSLSGNVSTKVSYAGGIRSSEVNDTSKKLGLDDNSIARGETLQADFKLGVGYELYTTTDSEGKIRYTSPSITLQYATQVADANGYRLAEKATYSSDYEYEALRGQNIKLDEDGNRLDFDGNGNLKYYLKITNTGTSSDNAQPLTYLNGAYYYVGNEAEVEEEGISIKRRAVEFIVPTVTVVSSKTNDETEYITFKPTIQVKGDDGTWVTAKNYKSFSDYIKVDEDGTVYLDSTNVKIEYYSSERPDCKLSTVDDKNDLWKVTVDGVICNVGMSRNQNNIMTYTAPGDNNYNFSITANYCSVSYPAKKGGGMVEFGKTDTTEATALKNNSYTGYNYEGKAGDQTRTLIASNGSENYEPWVIYASSTLSGAYNATSENNYETFKLSTGYSSPAWNNRSKQFFVIYPDGSVEEMQKANSSNFPYITIRTTNETLYAVLDSNDGMFKLHSKKSNGSDTIESLPNDTYANFKVVCIDPVTVDVFVVNGNDCDKKLTQIGTSDSYSAGETVFRLRVDSVVSDVEFTINDSTVQDYQYKINFQTNFMGEKTDGAITLSDGWNITAKNGGTINKGIINTDVIKTIGTAENGQMTIQYYDQTTGNISGTTSTTTHNYYFLAPIDQVVASCINEVSKASNESSSTIKIIKDGSNYYVEDKNGNRTVLNWSSNITNSGKTFICYSANGNNYYFTSSVIYQFAGWQVTSTDGLDDEIKNLLKDADVCKTISNSEIEDIKWKFTDTKTSVTFQAVYEECEVNVEFYSWNMSEDGSGIYNVIEKIKEGNKDDYYNNHYEELVGSDGTIYSLKGIKYASIISDTDDKYTPIKKYIDEYSKFAGNSASAYGTSKGWFVKSNNAEYDILRTLNSSAFSDLGNLSQIEALLVKNGYVEVTLWDGKVMYSNAERTKYFSIAQNGSNFICEYYSKFTLGTTQITNNTQLYEVYEIGNKTVNVTGFEDSNASIYTNTYSVIRDYTNEVKTAGDLNVTISLTDAYSNSIGAGNVENFIKSLTINTTSKYSVSGVYGIDFKNTYSAENWNSDTRKYVFRSVIEGSETLEYGYIQFNENYTTITIYIKGVIANVAITTNYAFNRNSYEITIDSPSAEDGQGNSISYGTFYIVYYKVTGETEETMTQEEVVESINFSALTTQEIKNGEKIIASYTVSGGKAIITVYYEYDLYIKFVSNVAYSQYFTNGVLWQAKVGEDVVNFARKTGFDSTSEDYLQYFNDSTNSTTTEKIWYYGLMSVKNDYALTYDESIYINKYEVKSTSENNNYYSISLDKNDGRDYAKYNENVDVVITIKDAYTQFTPVVNATINGNQYLVVFAHLYDMSQTNGTYKTITIDNNNTTTVTYYTANGGYYEYANSNHSKNFRVYATAEVDGDYAGYYKFVEVSGDPEVETIITYIKYNFKGEFVKETVDEVETDTKVYDNLSYNYIIANLNTVSDFQYNVYGYKNNALWKSDNKNTYEINVGDLSNSHKDYYTVTDGNNTSLSYDETEGESNPLASVTHGTQVVIKVAMNSAYTQTIPKFKITVGEKTYTINCESSTILNGVDGEFTIDNKVVYNEEDNSRTYTFLIAGLEVEIKQEFVYDSVITTNSLSALRSELQLNYVGYGKDNMMYASATYTITVTATDSFTIEDVTGTYSPNKYYVVFNRQVNSIDNGVIQYVHESIKDGEAQMYYQIVNNNATAQNPFKDSVTAPGTSIALTLENFKSEAIEGYSYTGSEDQPWTTDLTSQATFNFSTNITKHYILYAPYTEEQYTVVVNGSAVDNSTNTAKWNATTNNHYGKLTTTNINDADTSVADIQVKYTDTGKMKVSYQLFHAYDHSSIKFSISQYGELKYNESSYVGTNGINISVSKETKTNETKYTYKNSNDEILAIITVTTNNESSLDGLSTIYTLELKKKIDAGNTAVGNTTGDKIDGKIEITVDFVKGSEDVANQENGLNIYKVYIHQGQFNTDTVQDVMTNTSYTWHTYKTYDDAENLDETSGIGYITVTHNGTVLADAVKTKVSPITYDGYNFNGWRNGSSNQWLSNGGSKSGIYDEIHLYELYVLKDANEITAYNSTGTLNDTDVNNPIYVVGDVTTSTNNANAIFKNVTVTNGKTNVQYTDEFVVKYTLKDACSNSNNSNLKFKVDNATITSCVYDENTFTYTLTLKYFRGDSSYTVQLNETTVSVNTYTVDFKYYYDYSSNYSETDGWTQSINISKYEFAGASLSGNYVHGSDASGKQASIPVIGTIPALKNGLEGFSNRNNMWMYISRLGSNANIDDNDIKEAILKVLNMGDCLSDGSTINVKVGDVTYVAGLFYKDGGDETTILGRMVVVPYFVRNEIEVTFNELIEGSSDFSMIKDEEFMGSVSDDASYYRTTYIPYGMPIDKDLLKEYHYIDDFNDSSAIEYWSEVVSKFANDKNEHFVFNTFRIIGDEFTNLSTYVVKSSITLNVDYNRREYEVIVYKSTLTAEKLGTFNVKYGEEFGNTYEIDYWDYGANTVEELVKNKITAGQGKHVSGWRDYYYSAEENPTMIITENRGFYPNIDIDEYKVSLDITNSDLGISLTRYDIYYTNYDSVSNADGYYEVSSDKGVVVEYFYTIGYEKEPIITISVNGEINNNVLEVSLNNETAGKWKLTIAFNTNILKHEDVVNIEIKEQISTYEITWPELNSTISTNSGLTYRWVEYSLDDRLGYGYKKVEANGLLSEGYAVIFYIDKNQEIVNYNDSLTVYVWVAGRYIRSSTIKFTISAGANSSVVTLENLKDIGESDIDGDKQFICTLNNITDNIEITIDGDVTEIIPSQYEITYHYYFGGGINGWEEKADKPSVKITVQASDSQADTYDIVGGSAPSAPTNVESNYNSQYSLYNGGGKWYVSKNGLINFNADINYENIEDYFDEFNYSSYSYTDNIDVYFFYIIKTNTVSAENVSADKGNLQLPSIGENYVSDHKSKYKFSYEVKEQYSQNIPVVTIKVGDKTYDLITLKDISSGTIKKSSTESYVVTLTADGYKYVLSTNTLGAVDGNTYYVAVVNGEYTISYGANSIATVKLENNKQIIILASVDGDLSIDINDEMFELNSYKITFKHGDGSVDELTVKYGNKLTDIPTDDKSFIQKLVYIVTYSDGTTKQLSSKGLAKMEISDDLTIEISVEINLVILIPLVVGAVVVVVAIVVGITKVTRNRSDRHSSGRSNMEAFDRLRQDRTLNNNDASKKSDRPYNPYIDNSKDRKQ